MKKLTVLLIAAAVLLCGCQSSGASPDTTEELTPAVTEEPEPYPLSVNDVEIISQPQKVVCLSPSLAEIIYELGYGDKIIARSSYCDYPAEISSAKDVGTSANPDIDAIIDLLPDLLLTSAPIASKDVFTMEQAGIKTLVIPAPTTLEGFSSIYVSLGLIFEGMFTGTEKGEETYSAVSKALGNTDAINIGNFVYITEGFAIAGGDTFESAVLSCFGTNAAKNSSEYGFEAEDLLTDQPDIILLSDKYKREDLLEDEIFSQLDAVIEDKIIYINNIYFERPSSRIIELTQRLTDDYAVIKRQENG